MVGVFLFDMKLVSSLSQLVILKAWLPQFGPKTLLGQFVMNVEMPLLAQETPSLSFW